MLLFKELFLFLHYNSLVGKPLRQESFVVIY